MSWWTDKRVLVTGATGFLGRHMVEALREANCGEVIELSSKDANLTREPEVLGLFERLTQVEPVDVVFGLAGLVGGIQANKARPGTFFYDNLMMGTLTLHASYKFGVKKFVAAAAGCGYPEFSPVPVAETHFWNGMPQRETAPFALAKRMLHAQSMAYWDEFGFPALIALPGNVYGPYDNFGLQRAHVMPALVRRFIEAVDENKPEVVVWGSGKATRDFVYASDIARGMLVATEKYNESQLFNLSSGTDTSIAEVVDELVTATGYKGVVEWDRSKPEGQMRRRFDIAKAESELGYKPTVSLKEGIALTVDWYRKNRHCARN